MLQVRKREKLTKKFDFFRKKNPNFLIFSGRVLVEMSDDDLREIGVETDDERQDLLLEIKKEKLYSDLDEFSKLRTPPTAI